VGDIVTAVESVHVIDDRVARLVAAKTEFAAWKVWNSTGRKGAEPVTVNLESVRNEEPTTSKENKMSKTPTTKTPVTYYRNGVPMPERYNYLADLGSRSGTSAGEITERLVAEQGIDKPKQTTWKLTLPSGMIIGCVVDGDTAPAGLIFDTAPAVEAPKKTPVKPAAKKPPVKAAARPIVSRPKAAAKKPAAKKTAAKR
jgi:hypothetical protein